ncbi:MAG: hypothetical protein ACFFC7_04510 [Candidatus Hermodarchaeota archaeon]
MLASNKVIGIAAVIIIVIVASLGIVALHDGVLGTTPIKSITEDYNNWINLSVTVKGTYRGSFYSLLVVNDSTGGILVSYEGVIGVSVGDTIIVSGVVKTIDIILIEFPYINATEIHTPWVLN